MKKLDEYLEYDSYTQIFSEEIEKEEYSHCSYYDRLFDLFSEIAGQRFFPTLTQGKFNKLLPILKRLNPNFRLNKFFLDNYYKRIIEYHEQLDFYAFIDGVEDLVSKCMDNSGIPEKEWDEKLLEAITSCRRPLYYIGFSSNN